MNPKPPFSPFVRAGNLIFTSGQIHLTSDGKLLEGTIKDQTRQVMENLKGVLEKAGVTFNDVVKTTIYLTDMSYYTEVNEVYAIFFKDTFPAREAIGVKELPLGAKIEISMIAVKS